MQLIRQEQLLDRLVESRTVLCTPLPEMHCGECGKPTTSYVVFGEKPNNDWENDKRANICLDCVRTAQMFTAATIRDPAKAAASSQADPRDSQVLLCEAIAAISASFHANQVQYQAWYDEHADHPDINGFVGIWQYMVRAAEAFVRMEIKYQIDWAEYNWIDAVGNFSGLLHSNGPLAGGELDACALSAINNVIF